MQYLEIKLKISLWLIKYSNEFLNPKKSTRYTKRRKTDNKWLTHSTEQEKKVISRNLIEKSTFREVTGQLKITYGYKKEKPASRIIIDSPWVVARLRLELMQ